MRKNSLIILGCALVLVAGASVPAWAGLSPDEIAKLGNELTPTSATMPPPRRVPGVVHDSILLLKIDGT